MAVLLSVNLGRLRPKASGRSRHLTGIDKRPTADAVEVRAPGGKLDGLGSGLVGDEIGDHGHHGGDEQAVYAYAREELDDWEQRLGRELRSGMFGENLTTRGLVALATRIVKADKPFSYDVDPMTPVRHPHDDGVWLGDVATLRALPPGVDAVVSLCRVDDEDLPVGVEQIDVRLIDDVGPDANPHLDFVLTDTVRLIEQLRNEGCTVLVHCVAAQSRTPTVAALYGARRQGISGEAALREVTSVLPDAYPNSDFRRALKRLAP